ncbi:UNVERIFIED_CONTAM: hypothetical protein Sradi_0661500 [Sesamum radiatum]|uniref:NAD-dependent epimerase/dehydratase domain-containing protein n=1 Tax=Sesamum radiatum TaxID=300843 RepID=A0AAW2VNM6_SESRA
MEICRVQRQSPPINLRFDQKLVFHPVRVRCNLSQDAKTSAELCSGGRMFILGMGFVGQFFAADCKAKGWVVSGSCTSIAKKKMLEELGYQTHVFDANDPHYPVKPASELARARLAAEEEWLCLGHNLGIAAQVFRLGGIYGPGRSAVDTILKQGPLSKGQKRRVLKNYTSRVHVADICQALHASILRPSAGKIYNIVDDDPAPRTVELAQKLIEGKFPGSHGKQYKSPERAESLVTEKASRGKKRVSNARMKKELSLKLIHPTYRSGLRSIIDNMDSSLMQESPGHDTL